MFSVVVSYHNVCYYIVNVVITCGIYLTCAVAHLLKHIGNVMITCAVSILPVQFKHIVAVMCAMLRSIPKHLFWPCTCAVSHIMCSTSGWAVVHLITCLVFYQFV